MLVSNGSFIARQSTQHIASLCSEMWGRTESSLSQWSQDFSDFKSWEHRVSVIYLGQYWNLGFGRNVIESFKFQGNMSYKTGSLFPCFTLFFFIRCFISIFWDTIFPYVNTIFYLFTFLKNTIFEWWKPDVLKKSAEFFFLTLSMHEIILYKFLP